MIEIEYKGIKTVRSLSEIWNEFVDSNIYDFIKCGMTTNERGAIRSWIDDSDYVLDDDRELVEYLAHKL